MRAICLFALVLLPAAMAYSSASSSATPASSSSTPAPTPAAASSSAAASASGSPTPASSYGSASTSGAYSSASGSNTASSGSNTASSTAQVTYNVVKAALKFPGVSPSAFSATTTAGKALRAAFKSSVAKGLKICGTDGKSQCTSTDVVIESVSRRRADATVKFYVKTQSATAAAGATSLNTYVTSGTGGTSFIDILKAEAKTGGVPDAVWANATTPTFTEQPSVGTVSTPTPTVSKAGKTAVAGGVTMALAGLAMLW